jgi:hypothetical protein
MATSFDPVLITVGVYEWLTLSFARKSASSAALTSVFGALAT